MIKLKNLISEAVPNILTSNIKEIELLYAPAGRFYKMKVTDKGDKSFKIVSIQDADRLLKRLGVSNTLPTTYDYETIDLIATELPKNIKVSHDDTMDIS